MKATHKFMAMEFCGDFIESDDWGDILEWVLEHGYSAHKNCITIWVRYCNTYMVLPDHIEYLTRRVLGKGI